MSRRSGTANTLLPRQWGVPNTAGVSISHELAFERVSYEVDGASILKNVTLTAPAASVTCLLGPSGSGKTSLLRIAAGMQRQTDGRILMDSREISGDNLFVPPEKRGIGLVFQDYALFPHLCIIDNVLFGLRHLGRDARLEQAKKMLVRVGLAERASDFPHNLSGGEQQRVALARAMAPRPGVLLMDEPFSGLDSRLRDLMRDETLGILRETRATSVIVTHDPEEALRMGDQIALLHEGKLEQVGTGRELFFKPDSLFSAGFFSELNVFEGRADGGTILTPLGPVAATGMEDGARAVAAIRVGAVMVNDPSSKEGGTVGRALTVHFSGDQEHLVVGINGTDQQVRARVHSGSLSPRQLEGSVDVVLTTDPTGSFAFSAG